jgi:hypothetical protein
MKCGIHLEEMGEKTVCTTQIKLRTDWSMGGRKQKLSYMHHTESRHISQSYSTQFAKTTINCIHGEVKQPVLEKITDLCCGMII